MNAGSCAVLKVSQHSFLPACPKALICTHAAPEVVTKPDYSDEELRALVDRALQQAGGHSGLNREQFSRALSNTDLGEMSVTIDASMF